MMALNAFWDVDPPLFICAPEGSMQWWREYSAETLRQWR